MRLQPMRWTLAAIGIAGLSTTAQAQRFSAYECNDGAKFQVALLDTEKMAYLQLDGHPLQLPKKTLYDKLTRHALVAEDFRRQAQ